MTAAPTLQEAEKVLTAHRDRCNACAVKQACGDLARLTGDRDRLWLAQLGSLTTRRRP